LPIWESATSRVAIECKTFGDGGDCVAKKIGSLPEGFSVLLLAKNEVEEKWFLLTE
jgi:hypothetical protein